MAAIRPACENDVVKVVKYARIKNIPFAPRSGHHCVTTTMRHLKDGILIDMRSLSNISFNEAKRHVTIGGGVITDDFVCFLESRGMEVSKSISKIIKFLYNTACGANIITQMSAHVLQLVL